MEIAIILLFAVAAILLLPLIWLVANYNRFVRVRQHLRESWADIDVELKRRYELIPNLVETAKGYAAHESGVFEEVARLRNQAEANHGSAASRATDESALQLGVKKLFALAEGYPELKANEQFLALQEELANTEDRIAASRRFFNGNVREMNQLCEQFPSNLVASIFGFASADYFELSSDAERVVPRVAFHS